MLLYICIERERETNGIWVSTTYNIFSMIIVKKAYFTPKMGAVFRHTLYIYIYMYIYICAYIYIYVYVYMYMYNTVLYM